jgi:hypothetical protein
MADPICWWCKEPVPERTILHVADIPGVAAIFGHRACFVKSSYNQSPLGPIFGLRDDRPEVQLDRR